MKKESRKEAPVDFQTLPRFVAIVGSREFIYKHWVTAFVERLRTDSVVVSGGARGVDTWADEAAIECGLKRKIFPIEDWEWQAIGNKAAHIRNEAIARYIKFNDGHLFAFGMMRLDGSLTKGTQDVITTADAIGVPTTIFTAGI